jgi:hypothetical protein
MGTIILADSFDVSRSPQLSNTRLLNFFTERQAPDAKGQAPLFGAPGLISMATVGVGPFRGGWNLNGVAYYVSGDSLYSVGSDQSVTLLGSGIGGTTPVGMSDNGVQLCVVNGAQGWIYNVNSGTYTRITSAAFYAADTVTFMDGYFIFDRKGTNEWFLSALYDGLTYNGLDFASAEGQPGLVMATVQNLQLLFIFCSAHIELWYDAGTANFPFQRYAGGIINFGTISPYTICKQDGAVFFLGADHVFYRLQANVPVRVSTHAVEHVIQLATDITQAFCTTWTIEGHKMVCLTIPSTKVTLCFDISTGKWHERGSVDAGFNDLGGWRIGVVLAVYDSVYMGDTLSGALGKLDWQTYTEFGNPMVGLVQTANQQRDRKRIYCSRFEIDVEAGVGLTAGQGSDPVIMLQRSKDGGMTWSKAQLGRSMGKAGEYTKRLRWLAQGQGRQLLWRLIVTDPVQRTIIGAYADLSEGV